MNEKNMSKWMGQSINDYSMIAHGDRVLVGLSGGVDSITLLLLLFYRLKRIPIDYTIKPVLIDILNGEDEERNEQIQKLAEFVKVHTDLEVQVVRVPTFKRLLEDQLYKKRDLCYFCAQRRRSALLKIAFDEGYNKVALGHHLDDIIETSLLNLFYKRELSTMLPRLELFGGKIDLIRPLCYIPKSKIIDYSKRFEEPIPIFEEICPVKAERRNLRREKVRNIVLSLSKEIPHLKENIFASFRNPKPDYLLDKGFSPKSSGLHKRP